jgi:hypothetical protein
MYVIAAESQYVYIYIYIYAVIKDSVALRRKCFVYSMLRLHVLSDNCCLSLCGPYGGVSCVNMMNDGTGSGDR